MPTQMSNKTVAELQERLSLLRLKAKKATVRLGDRLDKDLVALLGRPCKVTCTSPQNVSQEEFRASIAGTDSFWAVSSVQGNPRSRVVIRFPFEVAATVSGLLLVMADSRVLEKVQERELTEEDMDVLEEVANQLRGILMRTLQRTVHGNVHLNPEYFIRSEELPESFPSGYACSFSVKLQIPGLLDSAFDIAIDFDALAELFHVNISASDVLALEENSATSEKENRSAERHSGTAVLIASNGDAQDTLRAAIEQAGLRAARVPDFQELSNAVRSGLVRVVLIDASSGIEKGLKLARVLRSFSPHCAIIVGATAWSREHVLESLRGGVDVLLTRPYKVDVVARKIADILTKKGKEKSQAFR